MLIYKASSFYISSKKINMAYPIWKDYYVTLGAGASYEYRVLAGGSIIYSGKAAKRPGNASVQIKINDICADYLNHTLPNLSPEEFTELQYPINFIIQVYNGSWSNVASVEFLNDWSYDYAYNVATEGMAFPINGKVDSRQWLTYTAYGVTAISATITMKDGSKKVVSIPLEIDADFNSDFNTDFARSVKAAGGGTAVFKVDDYGNVASIKIGKADYKVVSDCARYALYYINAYGGWDALLIEGSHQEADDLQRYLRDVEYDNRDVQNRSKKNYINEITKRMVLHTSWMSDTESLKMHHLMNSIDVYMYDFLTEQMIPVVVDNAQCKYKTYKGEGCRLVNYAIDVTIAHDRIRRR